MPRKYTPEETAAARERERVRRASPEFKAAKAAYRIAYLASPEGQAVAAANRADYYSRPEVKAARKAHTAARKSIPEVKAARAAYLARPEVRAAYLARPEVRASQVAAVARYRKTAKGGVSRAASLAKPEYKAGAATREKSPECQAYRLAYRSTPEVKAAMAARSAVHHAARRGTEEYKAYRRAIEKARKSTPLGILMSRLRCLTTAAFRRYGFKKGSKTSTLLGCEWGFLKSHIEAQFTEGMTWETRHLWHIDHILPLSSAKDEVAMVKLCHYTNLQPLWWRDNIAKGAKIPVAA